jgi:hypothetical protein
LLLYGDSQDESSSSSAGAEDVGQDGRASTGLNVADRTSRLKIDRFGSGIDRIIIKVFTGMYKNDC